MKKHWYILPLLLLLAGGTAFGQSGAATQPPDEMAPQNLDWTLTQEGNVRLDWEHPIVGTDDLDHYEVWRSEMYPNAPRVKIASTNRETEYTDLSIKPGESFIYEVWAYYVKSPAQFASIAVRYSSDSQLFEIVSDPPTTVKTGNWVNYKVEMNADPRITSITTHLEGKPPAWIGAQIINNSVRVSGEAETGVHEFTLVVTGIDHLGLTVKATQNIRIVVAPRTGAVDITVSNIHQEPIPFSHIQLILFPEDIPGTKINVTTDEFGHVSLSDIPVGEIIAFCYPGDERYQPKYYNIWQPAQTLSEAEPQRLAEDDVLNLEFTLTKHNDENTTVRGVVLDQNGFTVPDAKVHFIRKSNFIIIGDRNLKENPVLIENWNQAKIDTTVSTDLEGKYTVLLPIGIDYFIVVESAGHFDCFSPNLYYNSNALEARPFTTQKGVEREFNYRIEEKSIESNSIQGVVRREENNLGEPATVLLIKKDVKLQRGTGGGVFYGYGGVRSVLTDSNGVYQFQNIPEEQYILFAIPFNRDVVPQYFTDSYGGAMTFENSSLITVSNTIQNKNFLLKPAVNDGLGTLWGVVNLQKNSEKPTRLSGAVVFAIDPKIDQIVGYSISDSLGNYAIPNLRPGIYHVIADHPAHGWDMVETIDLQYKSIKDDLRDSQNNLTIHITVSGIDDFDPSNIPADVVLHQNYPNPFNPSTNIKFGLSKSMNVRLSVYNVYGQEVEVLEEGDLDPGTYSFQFDASGLASGMYYYRLTAGTKILTRSMMLVK